MEKLSPYYLWEFAVHNGDRPFSCTDGERKYADYRLSYMLEHNNLKLRSVVISNDIETYMNLDDVHYLKARVVIETVGGKEYYMDIRPFYSGDDDEWALLMMDKRVDDIDIRFSLSDNKFEPQWIAVIEDDKRIKLTGDRMEWDLKFTVDNEIENEHNRSLKTHHYYGASYDAEDLTEEELDPDYMAEDSPYESWRLY